MNTAQELALANHCRLASETVQSQFAYDLGHYSVVLTVNSGYE